MTEKCTPPSFNYIDYNKERVDWNYFNKDGSPIILTLDWLLIFGFKFSSPSYEGERYFVDNGIPIFPIVDLDGNASFFNGQYRFVHELQNNYFYMTDKKLLIENSPDLTHSEKIESIMPILEKIIIEVDKGGDANLFKIFALSKQIRIITEQPMPKFAKGGI